MKATITKVQFEKNVLTPKGLSNYITNTEIEMTPVGFSIPYKDGLRLLYPWSKVEWVTYEEDSMVQTPPPGVVKKAPKAE